MGRSSLRGDRVGQSPLRDQRVVRSPLDGESVVVAVIKNPLTSPSHTVKQKRVLVNIFFAPVPSPVRGAPPGGELPGYIRSGTRL